MGADAQHVIYQVEYQRAVRTQIQAILEQLQADEFETVSEYLTKSYEDGFVGAMYSLHNQGMPFIFPIDQAQVVKAIQHDTHLTSSLYTVLGLDLAKLKKTISHEISRGIASNMLYPEITGNVSRAAGVPLRRARTIVRTEAGRIQEQATMDAAEKAISKGADLVKQWSAVRDGKTRYTHRRLDGQIREIEEPFEVGGKEAMQPHGFGIASEDCNCRCTTLLRARDALDEEEYKRLQDIARQHGLLVDDSKKYGHDKAKDFADFKGKYLRATQTINTPSNYGEKEIPYSKRGIDIGDRLKGYLKTLSEAGKYLSSDTGTISHQDLAILTTETGVEFTTLTIGNKEYLIRGNENGTTIPEELWKKLIANKGTIDCHSHPYVGDLTPSKSDREALKLLKWQQFSGIIEPGQHEVKFDAQGAIVHVDGNSNRDEDYYASIFGSGE